MEEEHGGGTWRRSMQCSGPETTDDKELQKQNKKRKAEPKIKTVYVSKGIV